MGPDLDAKGAREPDGNLPLANPHAGWKTPRTWMSKSGVPSACWPPFPVVGLAVIPAQTDALGPLEAARCSWASSQKMLWPQGLRLPHPLGDRSSRVFTLLKKITSCNEICYWADTSPCVRRHSCVPETPSKAERNGEV